MQTKLHSECTTMLVGKEMTNDNSMIVARSEDYDVLESKRLKIFKDNDNANTNFEAKDSSFKCKLPNKALGYTAIEPFCFTEQWGEAGFNTAGVGMSATESIFSSEKALQADPMVDSGIAENTVYNITIPFAPTAKEGIIHLGKMIEQHGVAEGFGVALFDKNEIWYLETACGHRWLACRIPDKAYFITGNQSRFIEYNPNDTNNYLASADLIEFAQKHNLYDAKTEEFNFHKAYIGDTELDKTYNYPRVWGVQQMLSPSIKNEVDKNTFPVYAEAENPITVEQVKQVFRYHYQGTEHDPYFNNNPKEEYRPISIFRTLETHILQIRPNLPQEIGNINYIAMGMAALGVFIPFYQGTSKYLDEYTKGEDYSSNDSAYWKFKKVQSLGMINYNKYAPIIQKAYAEFEQQTALQQKEMEYEYMNIYKHQPLKAKELIQNFADKTMRKALDVTDELIEKLFTMLAVDIQAEYPFSGA